jgi:hypothetical protein
MIISALERCYNHHSFAELNSIDCEIFIKSGIFEVGQTLTDAGTTAEEIVELLQSYGYIIHKNFSSTDYVFTL